MSFTVLKSFCGKLEALLTVPEYYRTPGMKVISAYSITCNRHY